VTSATPAASSRRRALGVAASLVAPALLLTASPARASTTGDAPCPSPRAVAGGTALQLCSESRYVDSVGVTHLLGFIRNPGQLVQVPAARIAVVRPDNTRVEVTAYTPLADLPTGASTLFDYEFDGPVTSAEVIALTGQPALTQPNDMFRVGGVRFGGASDDQVVSGTLTNDTGRKIVVVKLGYVAFDRGGTIAWYGPTVITSDNRGLDPGSTTEFSVPRRDIPSYAVLDPTAPFFFAQGNEPSADVPAGPASRVAGSSLAPVPRTAAGASAPRSHGVVTDTGLAGGVRPPSAADLAAAAHPGTATPSHDPVVTRRAAAGALPGLIDAAPAKATTDDGTTKWFGPLLILLAVGLIAGRMLRRDAAATREARALRRAAREDRDQRRLVQPDLAEPDYVAPVARRPSPGSA